MQTQKPSNSQVHLRAPHRDEVKEDTRETILLGIDGTADLFDSDYKKSMDASFVSRIVRECPTDMKQYIRGPARDGIDMVALISKGYEFVHLRKFAKPDAKVLLTGYSRGGAGVVGVAQRLKRDDIKVDGMVLFDPVNRSVSSSTDEVPNNVLNMVQARRATESYSRLSFNNCAVIWHAPTQCDIRYFWATHGGVGGVPWPVEPGKSPKDFIDEGFGEHYLTNLVYAPLGLGLSLHWEQPRDYDGNLSTLIFGRMMHGGSTQVTFEQDRWGAENVWKWVLPWLRKLGFLTRK